MSTPDFSEEVAETARDIVETCMSVRTGEQVLIIADARKTDVAKNIGIAARAAGATVVTATMPLLNSHGNEPPELVTEAMKASDVTFTCTTHAITHTQARLQAADAGTRVCSLRSVTSKMMVDGAMNVDFEWLKTRTELVRDQLTEASSVHVTSDEGTDIEFSITDCLAFSLDGYFHEDYGFATLPPGESPTHPSEGTANGTIVIDVSMDNLGTLEEPITLEIEDGFVTDVNGGEQANELRSLIERSDDNAGNLAEFAIGTNPQAKLIGNLAEDKKRAGTVHFAIGDNESLGGTTRSEIHLDGVIRSPTVRIDETTIVNNGSLQMEE